MEVEFIVVAIISGVFTLSGIMLLNHNWFKREDMKYKYKLKYQKASGKMKFPSLPGTPPPGKTPLSDITGLLGLAKNLDADGIRDILDIVRGETGGGGGSDLGEYAELLKNPAIQSIIQGITTGVKKENVDQEPDQQTAYQV